MEVFNSYLDIVAIHEIIKDKGRIVKTGDLNNIAPKSIPEIIRQLKNTLSNSKTFSRHCIPNSKQPTYHMRQIIKLKKLYDNDSLYIILNYCI